jgi:hypothetical protein
MLNNVTHRVDVEATAPSQQKTHNKNIKAMTTSHSLAHQKYTGAGGVLKGKLIVPKDLPAELAQGIFAKPGTRDCIVHLATAMSESGSGPTVCGMSIEVLGHSHSRQPNPGHDSGNLLVSGHKKTHAMAEEYHSQAPVHYGNTTAKFAIVPSSPGLLALKSHPFSPETPNALREAIIAFFHCNPAEFDFKVQLKMDNQDSTKPTGETSLYRTVARLVIPSQIAHEKAAESLAFSPAVVVPQESASRLAPYSMMSKLRRRKNNRLGRLNILPA